MNLTKRIILWLVLALACFLPASASVLALIAPENRVGEIFSIGYDVPTTEATDLGSRTETSTSNYDTAPIHRAITEEIPTEANRSLLAQNAEFKSAEGVSVASGAGESASSTLVRNIGPNESFDDIAHELSQLTYETGNEHAYVVLGDGQSAIVSGGPGGINFSEGEVNAIVAHTHPIEAPSGLPSPADMNALQQLNQQNSMILYRGGQYEFGQ